MSQEQTTEARTSLLALASRLEDYRGIWDSRMDEDIARAIGWDEADDGWHAVARFFTDGILRRTSYAVDLPAFTRDLDDAMSLVQPDGYPLWTARLDIRSHGQHGMSYDVAITVPSREAYGRSRCKPALAVCAAALRAREAFYGH